jgi:hypothetical protein
MHKRPGPACCENARDGCATSQQRAGPEKALVRKSRFRAEFLRSPKTQFFSAQFAEHQMLWIWNEALHFLGLRLDFFFRRARRMGSAAAGWNQPTRN